MIMKRYFALVLIAYLFGIQPIISQEVKELFQSDELLKIDLLMPLKEVTRDLQEKREHQATLSYLDESGQKKEFSIKISTRGKTRKKVCAFPPLELNFKKKQLSESIFSGQDKIKLVTHCKGSKSFEDYIRKEYAVYKLYQQLVPYSYQVRLCEINYRDLKKPDESNIHIGFMIEPIKDLAERNQMELFKGNIVNQEVTQKDYLDKLVMFQFLIGNLDWSIPERHNMKIIRNQQKGLPVAVPFDFDYCGMVNTPYAVPPEGIEISSVKVRRFRGLCRHAGYAKTIDFYQQMKQVLYDEINNAQYLSANVKNDMTKYLDSFYDLISDPTYVKNNIDKACRAKHKHIYEY